MEFLQLEYFKTIAECQHITKAATKLMVSQPSLSNTLARIEGELGVQLFDRQGRNIVLNDFGRILLKHANNILREVDNLKAEIGGLEQQKKKTLTTASNSAMYNIDWLPAFLKENPDLNFRHTIMPTEAIKEGLLNGTLDFGITASLHDVYELDHMFLYEDNYLVLVPKGHPLDQLTHRKFQDFKEAPFISRSSTYDVPRPIDELCAYCGIIPNIIFETETEFLRTLFIPLKAMLLVTKSALRNQEEVDKLKKVCTIVQLDDPFAKISTALSWDKNRHLSAAAQCLLNFLHTNPIHTSHIQL